MKARPILFSGPMIRALLDGRKTQTRRICKVEDADDMTRTGLLDLCPYGMPGDLLWVRESTTTRDRAPDGLTYKEPYYRADMTDSHGLCFVTDDGPRYVEQLRWTPGIHMPRATSRLTLRITDVRVQRLQEISEEDAKAEGAAITKEDHVPLYTHRMGFERIWSDINGHGSWDANPYVWALTFEVIKANVVSYTAARNAVREAA